VTWGGVLSLSIQPGVELNRDKILAGFGLLWGEKNAPKILEKLLEDRTTGATFTGSAEKCGDFLTVMQDSGVEIEVLALPPTAAQIALFSSVGETSGASQHEAGKGTVLPGS